MPPSLVIKQPAANSIILRAKQASCISPSDTARERAIVGFATLQFFAIIYLEKLALFPASFALALGHADNVCRRRLDDRFRNFNLSRCA